MRKIDQQIDIICVDGREDRREEARAHGFDAYSDLEKALEEKPKIAFICTMPDRHVFIAKDLLGNNIDCFLELNLLSDGYDELICISDDMGSKLFMSSTLLYDKSVQYIKAKVALQDKPLTYVYHVGQYLPDWHPWESYKDFFVSQNKTNAIREILAIQLPWIIDTFGEIKDVKVVSTRCTGLEIDYKDSMAICVSHAAGTIGTFTVDVVSRKPVTHLEVIGEDLYLRWDGRPDNLFELDFVSAKMQMVNECKDIEHIEGYAANIIENRYEDEIRDFLNYVQTGQEPKYSLVKDKEVLTLIDRIEEQAL